ncbi:MAG: phosphatidylglycerol lysyltransferase domain-containing protein [Jatrophihabitantaceae bacterium]
MSEGDPLAPFALRPEKSYVFSADGAAAVGYRVRLRTAVASGDPIGNPDGWAAAIEAFVHSAHARNLRVAVLGAGERARSMWASYQLSSVAIGRDVVVQRDQFSVQGRRYRNLRQAVQRSRNAGVTVEFYREAELPAGVLRDLRAVIRTTRRKDSRGFSMILGRLFDGEQPDAVVVVARDAGARLVAAHRYLWAGKQDLSLDLPIRALGAPNGVDERLIAEVVRWGAEHGVQRVSLAFAPFPDLFGNRHHLGVLGRLAYGAVHLIDPMLRVERLYRYLRKFDAFDQQRYVMLRWRQVGVVALVLLLLEFS